MARQRRTSTTSSQTPTSTPQDPSQEMASMYDYLAKIILLGPSGSGKSCLLHRFVKNEFRTLTSQTIGVEFASRIVKVGVPGGRKRVKLQLWDTAGTERFRSVSRSYYRGAAGAVLVYDAADARSFGALGTFLDDARALASPQLAVVLVGNKSDLMEEGGGVVEGDLLGEEGEGEGVGGSMGSDDTVRPGLGSQQRATTAVGTGRAVSSTIAAAWATKQRIPTCMEVSALSGDGVEEVFNKLARTILTKIELGDIDPDDPMSGIQYGDADYYRYDDGGSSIKSGLTSDGYGSTRRRRKRNGWGEVFRVGRSSGSGGGGGGGGKCC